MTADIVIIGAGMAGLACARQLAEAGRAPVVLDKGRGIGGRMATRRMALEGCEVRFDHGAQYVTVKDAGFAALLDGLPGAVAVGMAPCLTLMAAFAPDTPRPFVSRASDTYPLSWIAQDSTKPGRSAAVATWVAQASPEWSAQHLEEDRGAIATRMLPLLCEVIGAKPDTVLHVAAHRWRFARVTAPLGLPFLRSDDAALHLGGDWCLGPRVEAAWQSGDAIARDILGGHHAG